MGWRKDGFILIEALVASFILIMVVNAFSLGMIYNQQAPASTAQRLKALSFAREGLEAVRSIRDTNNGTGVLLSQLGNWGLSLTAGGWTLSGSSDANGNLTRVINLSSSGPNNLDVTATVTWTSSNNRTGQVTLSERITNWRSPSTARGGMVVYGNGGTTTDSVLYNNIDSSGVWGTPAAVADVDAGTTNRALRGAKLYASTTRNEKVLLTRHFNGTTTYLYAQVWNGGSGTWGNVILLSSFNVALSTEPFDGAYQANGNFAVVYSQNSTTPLMQVWNGTNWLGAAVNMQVVVGNPVHIVTRARPGTNEIMAVTFGSTNQSQAQYFNGAAYATANWSAVTTLSTASPASNARMVDFAWSRSSPLNGLVIYPVSGTTLATTTRRWLANGTGGGAWSGAVSTANRPAGIVAGPNTVVDAATSANFLACTKAAGTLANTDIYCYRSNTTPAWSTPGNSVLSTQTVTANNRVLDLATEASSGSLALAAYVDGTTTPKLKKYNIPSNTFDLAATNITTLPVNGSSVNLVADTRSDDIMLLMSDANLDLRSQVWNGSTDALYTTPTGKALFAHGTNGSLATDNWFTFAWDGHQ